ncbi:dynein regulatory complex protein 1 isoform X2 [Acanthochromis polyacanthus]|uniref:Dynein regulatory complex protein 1 n=1 Tax=Acanthochromis polyacanthus TaxID=80966 RepID=A0A3Q1FG84_9TELE|nr:dynein regulatory complex protein 1 isoform X2 [Acanthochromis polyacanthus]
MEKVDKDPEEAPGRSVLPEKQEAKTRIPTRKIEENPIEEGTEQSKRQEEQEHTKRIIDLQRELTTFVTNIQTAGDAKWLERKAELEESRRIRRERLENDVKTSQEKYDEIVRSWLTLNEKRMLQELHEALNSHQQLCDIIIADKKKLINDLQQELKKRDDHYVKTLRNNEEEIDLLIERMEEQMRTLTNAYREQLGQTETVDQQETEASLAQYKAEWQQEMTELWDKQIAQLTDRRDEVKNYEEKLHDQMLKDADLYNQRLLEENCSKFKVQREHQQKKAADSVEKLLTNIKSYQPSEGKRTSIKRRISGLQKERQSLQNELLRQQKELAQKRETLSKEYKCTMDQYERLQKQVKHFAVADATKFREMWQMCEEERKEQVEKILDLDSQICKHLGVAWERPPLPFMEHSGPIQPQTQAPRPDHQGEEGELSVEKMKKVMELLCDEAGFLMESKVLQLLAPLEKENQTVVKQRALFHSLGIKGEDVPELTDFLSKYKQEQGEQTEDVCAESSDVAKAVETSASTDMSSELIHCSSVLPALRSFLKQRVESRESTAHHRSTVGHTEARDAADYKTYWDSMANVISEDKLKMWDAAERKFRQYHVVLTNISELRSQNERLQRRNAELRVRVQEMAISTVGWSH